MGPSGAQASTLSERGPRVVVASGHVGLVWSSRIFSTNQTSCIPPWQALVFISNLLQTLDFLLLQ